MSRIVIPPDPKNPAPQRYRSARPPYRQLHVQPGATAAPKPAGSGIAQIPEGPLVVPGGAGGTFHTACDAPASTTTSNGGGPVLLYVQVLYYFWGPAWNNLNLHPGVGDIFLALSVLDDRFTQPPTNYFSKLAQYSGIAGSIANPKFGGFMSVMDPLVIPTNPPNNPFSVSDVTNEVADSLNDPLFKAWPAFPNDPETIYGGSLNYIHVFMPPGYTASGAFGEHTYTTDQYGNLWACGYTSYGALQSITYNFSHELIESMTDPQGTGWQVNPRNANSWNEICDVCCSGGLVNGTTVDSYWSQSDQACVIPPPPPPPPPLLPAGEFLVDCVLKARDESGDLFITHIGGPGNGSTGHWILTESEAIDLINAGQTSFYTEASGLKAKVIEEKWYLTTTPDSSLANNLDNLQTCT